jgi:hydrogenase expression/formation protein HypE
MARTVFKTGDLIDATGKIALGHGAGGLMTRALIEFLTKDVANRLVAGGVGLDAWDDGATIPVDQTGSMLIVTTDGHTVDPLFFPGGDLGTLAACGTLNDVLVMGGKPVAITNAIIIEEGFSVEDLARLNDSFVRILNGAGVALVGGDTKVMPKGALNGVISVTTGIGFAAENEIILDSGAKQGDDVVVTGTIGDHGTALLATRKGLSFQTDIVSDVHLLNAEVAIIRKYSPTSMKDPTRGGIATVLNEIAGLSKVSIWLEEDAVPFQQATMSCCDALGLNPYELASEGRAVVTVPGGNGEALVSELRALPGCERAAVIGSVRAERPGKVLVKTRIGGTRILATPLGEPIPRVC